MGRRILCTMLIALGFSVKALGQIPDGFVFVRGAEYNSGRVRVEDFEILDHTVTNAEYQAFVDATAVDIHALRHTTRRCST